MKKMLLKLLCLASDLAQEQLWEERDRENTLPVCEECVMTSHWFALSPIAQFQRCRKRAWWAAIAERSACVFWWVSNANTHRHYHANASYGHNLHHAPPGLEFFIFFFIYLFYIFYIAGIRICEDTLLPESQISSWACVLHRGHLFKFNWLIWGFCTFKEIMPVGVEATCRAQTSQPTNQPTKQDQGQRNQEQGTILTSICMCMHTRFTYTKHTRSHKQKVLWGKRFKPRSQLAQHIATETLLFPEIIGQFWNLLNKLELYWILIAPSILKMLIWKE